MHFCLFVDQEGNQTLTTDIEVRIANDYHVSLPREEGEIYQIRLSRLLENTLT